MSLKSYPVSPPVLLHKGRLWALSGTMRLHFHLFHFCIILLRVLIPTGHFGNSFTLTLSEDVFKGPLCFFWKAELNGRPETVWTSCNHSYCLCPHWTSFSSGVRSNSKCWREIYFFTLKPKANESEDAVENIFPLHLVVLIKLNKSQYTMMIIFKIHFYKNNSKNQEFHFSKHPSLHLRTDMLWFHQIYHRNSNKNKSLNYNCPTTGTFTVWDFATDTYCHTRRH